MTNRGMGSTENRRIDSWKEIAGFFGRDERTVKRWEKDRALPVHRVPGGKGGVFAYTAELVEWLNSASRPKVTDELAEGNKSSPDQLVEEQAGAGMPDTGRDAASRTAAEPVDPPAIEPDGAATQSARNSYLTWGVVALITLLAGGYATYLFTHRAHGGTLSPALSHHVPDREAQEFYLKGRYYWNRRSNQSLTEAIGAFTQAIQRDPQYAPPYAGLAECYDLVREYGPMPASESYPRAIEAANKAIELDDSLPAAHRALGFALFYWEWETRRALAEYQRAIQLSPNDVESHHWYATSLLSLGRYADALSEIEVARSLEPASPSILADRALILYSSGDRQRAMAELKDLERAEPAFVSPHRYLANIFLDTDNYEGYVSELRTSGMLTGNEDDVALAAAAEQGWKRNGERGMLEAMLPLQLKSFAAGRSSGYRLADTCARLGRRKDAVEYLRKALAGRDELLMNMSGGVLAGRLKGEPGFAELEADIQRKMGL
jgi:tetratricopeptide (TPR) repeat protein